MSAQDDDKVRPLTRPDASAPDAPLRESAPKPPAPDQAAPDQAEAAKAGDDDAAPRPRGGGKRAGLGGKGPGARGQTAGARARREGRNRPAGGKGAMPAPRRAGALQPVRPPASPARIERRHRVIALSFLLAVLLPVLISATYLWTRANDQYASYLGFSVRGESTPSAGELLGGLSTLVGGSASSTTDGEILYKFIRSHDLVERVNQRIDLGAIWSKAEGDPVFSYRGGAEIEDLLDEWSRKVRVYYDNGMIDVRVLAFTAQDAHEVAQAILDEGTIRINELNDIAREDTLRYAREELDQSLERLKEARQAVTEFRNRHQLVDPSADVQGQVGVVSSLQQQLAEQLVAIGLLRANAQANDPRIEQGELRISIIREQIEAERLKFGSETGEALSDVVGQFESLSVDRQFAETSYTASLAAYDAARAEAARQSRYLAAYVRPTLAQTAEYPEREKLMAILSGFLLILWTIGVLIFYSLRDRR